MLIPVVKKEIIQITSSFPVDLVFVASYAHMKNEISSERWVFVDSVKEAADLYIMNHVSKGDIYITQDIGLTSIVLSIGVYVLSPQGTLFEESKLETALELRHLSAKARRHGVNGKGPKPFSEKIG